jgi:hypothetical protein
MKSPLKCTTYGSASAAYALYDPFAAVIVICEQPSRQHTGLVSRWKYKGEGITLLIKGQCEFLHTEGA